jgi:hypothetical protein
MLGLESSVKWRGTDKVRATSPALARVYARCLPRTRCHRSHRGHSRIGLPGPGSAYGSRAEPWRTAGGASPARPWQCTAAGRGPRGSGLPLTSPCGLPRPRRGLLEERARSPGQPARPGGSARTRRGAARRRPAVRAGEPWVEDATAVASSGRQPHPDLLRQVPPTGSTVAMRLRLGCARLLAEVVGARQQAKGGDTW